VPRDGLGRNDPAHYNDPQQYEDLAATWWDPRGPFAMLHWLAASRAALIPPTQRTPDGQRPLLVDLGCGGGLLAPHVAALGYRHIGVDASPTALAAAAAHGIEPIAADVADVPLPNGCAAVVTAGEILEHVSDPGAVIDEAARLLAPGGTLVLDTIAAGPLSRFVAVTLAERLPGGPPRGLHDPALFVDVHALVRRCADRGIALSVHGIRPSLPHYLAWARHRRDSVTLVHSRLPAVLVAGVGRRSGSVSSGI
jgi:2-polyprenyl-6-hydroxyphenyl methylase/3-demethylubiquinone-9 3-methyltransferase